MLKVLEKMFLGCGVLFGALAFVGCEKDEEWRIWIEEGRRELAFGVGERIGSIRMDNVATVSACVAERGDMTYGSKSNVWGEACVSMKNWYEVENDASELLILQVDSNKNTEQRELILDFCISLCMGNTYKSHRVEMQTKEMNG